MTLSKRAVEEFFVAFWLVLGGCGAAELAAAFPGLGIEFLGVALTFGLTVLTLLAGSAKNCTTSSYNVVWLRFNASA